MKTEKKPIRFQEQKTTINQVTKRKSDGHARTASKKVSFDKCGDNKVREKISKNKLCRTILESKRSYMLVFFFFGKGQ